MLIARDLRIEVGPRVLIDEASFTLQPGDKVGLVGKNGAGKTTLMKTLGGERTPASGTLTRSGQHGYFSQEAHLERGRPDLNALERILEARGIGDLMVRMEDTRRKLESVTEPEEIERLITRQARLQDQLDTQGGYAAESEAKRIAAAVGIGNDELGQPIATMSGGQRRRVELARILFSETDALLLDEPTNHLDLDAKAWLMEYLAAYKGALLVVSHDLPLLDQSITSVLALEHGRIESYRGNYSHYLVERDRRREQKERERAQQDQKIAQLEYTIARFKGTTEKMAKKAKSMETRVDRIKRDLVEIDTKGRETKIDFPQPEPSNKIPIEASGLAKSFGDNLVFMDVDVIIDRGETFLIMGLNGAGKTTLLRILAGVERHDLGVVHVGNKTTLGYYAQEHEQIVEGKTVFEHVREVSDLPDATLRGLLGRFLLADKVDQDASTLSGGEKTKLALSQVVLSRANVLLLDEPTNNLDPQSKRALLEALHEYEGTIVLVSHDTDFVAELAPDRALMMPEAEVHWFEEELLELVALA
ncbi:MAG: ABC-F family ATP-binding cassette domain-containing protein [Acidimicrobiia bacterium]|nr:MAG: ABC-F family ATP-binding cassette domain-containing protein [Acidimicrobiia bacterium]